MMDCTWYSKWYTRNTAKKSLVKPSNLDDLYSCEPSSDFESRLDDREFLDYVETKLEEPLLGNFQKMRSGEEVSEADQQIVMEQVWLVKENLGL